MLSFSKTPCRTLAGPVWPGASVADLSTKLEPFFRARPPHKFSSAGRRHARPAAGAEKNQAPRQTADFIKKLGHLARVPACCAGQHLQHLVQLAVSAALSAQRQLAKHTDCSVDLLAPRSGAQTVWAQRVSGGVGKALLKDRGNQSKRRRLDEVAHSRGGASGQGPVGGHCSPSPSTEASPRSSVC